MGHIQCARQYCEMPQHILRLKITSPFKAQCKGGFQLAPFREEAHVAVPLHAEKLNMLPGLGALPGTGRSGSPIQLRHLQDG